MKTKNHGLLILLLAALPVAGCLYEPMTFVPAEPDGGASVSDAGPDSAMQDTATPDTAAQYGDALQVEADGAMEDSDATGASPGGDVDMEADANPDANPGPALRSCAEFATLAAHAPVTMEPVTEHVYAGEPWAMMTSTNIVGLGESAAHLGLEVVDRLDGRCVTHSESACTPSMGSTHYLTHGQAPAAGYYCVFMTSRPNSGKRYHAVYELTVEVPPHEQSLRQCKDLLSGTPCKDMPCRMENDGACDAG